MIWKEYWFVYLFRCVWSATTILSESLDYYTRLLMVSCFGIYFHNGEKEKKIHSLIFDLNNAAHKEWYCYGFATTDSSCTIYQ